MTCRLRPRQQICTNCRVPTELVDDHAAGDLICSECGLVLESHAIEESSEWRTFSDSDKANRGDPNRVGGPTDPLLSGGGMGTGVARGKGDPQSAALARTHGRQGDPDRVLLQAFGAIGGICSALRLPQTVKDAASELFKMALDNKLARGGRKAASMHAACVFIACRKEGLKRDFREICGGAEGTTVTSIGRAYNKLLDKMSELKVEINTMAFNDEAACGRFAATLGLTQEFSRAAREIAKGVRKLLEEEVIGFDNETRKQPLTVAAVSLYLAVTLHGGVRTSLADISTASSMAAETIDAAARWLFPHVRELCEGCATDFKRDEAVKRIEARYPRPVEDVGKRVQELIDACVATKELHPPNGLHDTQRPLVANTATAIATAVLQPQWQQKHNVGTAMAAIKPRAMAAAAVWLALRLSPSQQLCNTSLQLVRAAGGVAHAAELKAAAVVLFPRVRDLASGIPVPTFKSEEAIATVERDTARLLWIGDAALLATAVTLAMLSGAGAPEYGPSVAPAASALAPALHTAAASLRLQQMPVDAINPVAGAAAALLATRLLASHVVAPTTDDVARAAYVDAMPVVALARATFIHARQLAKGLVGCTVSEAALSAIEAEYPPPRATQYEDDAEEADLDDGAGFAQDLP